MATNGFRIIKFRGRYWIIYHGCESDPDKLGTALLDKIPRNSKKYQQWLHDQQAFFSKWDDVLQQLLVITPEDLSALRDPQAKSISRKFGAVFDERLVANEDLVAGAPRYRPIVDERRDIDYKYTFDLDLEVLIVDRGAHFRLDHISSNAYSIVEYTNDDDGFSVALPRSGSKLSGTDLTLDADNFGPDASEYWRNLSTRMVTARRYLPASPCVVTRRLSLVLFEHFQENWVAQLSVALLGWQAQDLPFRELVYFIVCLAMGGKYMSLVDERYIVGEGDYRGVIQEHRPGDGLEFVSSLTTGYRKKGMPTGLAPATTKYWLEGALISLVPKLNRPGILQKAIADVVHFGHVDSGHEAFNAVIISIEHLVLLKRHHDGLVSHTKLLPLVYIAMHLSMSARARYSDQTLNELRKKQENKRREAGYDGFSDAGQDDEGQATESIQFDDGYSTRRDGQVTGSMLNSDNPHEVASEESVTGHESMGTKRNHADMETVDVVWTPVDTMQALATFFEATKRNTMRSISRMRLPLEIIANIIRHVSDARTYNACLEVSREFRSICQRQPIVIDDIAFLTPKLDTPLSYPMTHDDLYREDCSQFMAVELSTNRHVHVDILWLSSERWMTCRVMVGSERDRKSYDVEPIFLSGLHVSTPQIAESPTSEHAPPFLGEHSGTETGDAPWNRWKSAFQTSDITDDADLSKHKGFWSSAITSHFEHQNVTSFDVHSEDHEKEWNVPPNTVQLFASYHERVQLRVSFERFSFHYLFVRIKKACAYWSNLWPDIIREAEERLMKPDPSLEIKEMELQPVGANEPFVLLAVGTEVRLFKWELEMYDHAPGETDQKPILRELIPGWVYDVTNAADQEVISSFLDRAANHRNYSAVHLLDMLKRGKYIAPGYGQVPIYRNLV
ncbi:hypothetical protein ACLMJK_005609 [Lecanora helva]